MFMILKQCYKVCEMREYFPQIDKCERYSKVWRTRTPTLGVAFVKKLAPCSDDG
jgi:hypothetical protein